MSRLKKTKTNEEASVSCIEVLVSISQGAMSLGIKEVPVVVTACKTNPSELDM